MIHRLVIALSGLAAATALAAPAAQAGNVSWSVSFAAPGVVTNISNGYGYGYGYAPAPVVVAPAYVPPPPPPPRPVYYGYGYAPVYGPRRPVIVRPWGDHDHHRRHWQRMEARRDWAYAHQGWDRR